MPSPWLIVSDGELIGRSDADDLTDKACMRRLVARTSTTNESNL